MSFGCHVFFRSKNSYKHNFFFSEIPLTSLCTAASETDTSPCVFPFYHDNMEYDECIPPSWQDALYEGSKPWCPMRTNLSGYHDPRFRANCNAGCRVVCVFIICRESIKRGEVPKDWKIQWITVIYKQGCKALAKN